MIKNNNNIINYIEVQSFFLIFHTIRIIISIYLLDIYKILFNLFISNIQLQKSSAIYYVYQIFLIYDDNQMKIEFVAR